jgi:hypothetical protein
MRRNKLPEKVSARLAVFTFNDTSHTWLDGNDRSLDIKELKSARLRRRYGKYLVKCGTLHRMPYAT